MAETLGSLCDKLTIVKLKQWHSTDSSHRESLHMQEAQLEEEIDEFIAEARQGKIPLGRLIFSANKVYDKSKNPVPEVSGKMGELFSTLAKINCELWHEVDKGYQIENVPAEAKDGLIRQLALLNLQRNQCIDQIDRRFHDMIKEAAGVTPK